MDTMDIASLSMGLSQSRIMGQVGTLMLAKSLDTQKDLAMGEVGMIEQAPAPSRPAMERSVNPSVGGNVDLYL